MAIETNIYNALVGDTAITALVATRIYPLASNTDSVFPRISYSRIGNAPRVTLDDAKGKQNPTIQIDCFARSYKESKDLADLVLARMTASSNNFVGILRSDFDAYEEDTRVFRVSMDFSIW